MEEDASNGITSFRRGMDAKYVLGRGFSTVLYISKLFFPQLHRILSNHPRVTQLLPILLAVYLGTSVFRDTITSWKTSLQSLFLKWMTSSVTVLYNDRLYDAFFRHYCSTNLHFPKYDFVAKSVDFIKYRSDRAELQNQLTLPGQIKNVIFIPSKLHQVFFYKRTLFYCKNMENNDFEIRCLGWSAKPIQDMLEELLQLYFVEKRKDLTQVYYPLENGNEWEWSIEIPARSLRSVSMEGKDQTSLLTDIESFLKGKQWYKDRQIPWRRGYLFHGPPGTGKSSAVIAVATHFAFPVYVLQFNRNLTDNGLQQLLRRVSDQNSIVLLEDLDSSGFEVRDDDQSEVVRRIGTSHAKNHFVTLSGLLNALDGLSAPEGAIYIMTTNHVQRLDPALTRPGRVDYRLKFDLTSQDQARSMFLHLYGADQVSPGRLEELASTFASRLPDKKVSPATLQDFLLRHRAAPSDAVDAVSEWVKGTLRFENKIGHNDLPGGDEN
jgi:chaperone BCS1